ncbi:allophanate hydrolase [Marmoricola sp. Leaf446]|uniref:5-oxoprolinase subunit C family protein n=1 Tax=Marmoricola sp. Leaf446 TaxID=1736379 RepID=UPI0006F87926|nr:biotin-dependent carboxyltransferase family protein [Marmoricola sp. Leaf446]KQT89238.1 allophanate hydrolase [Marmoricola sp. Leaf446]
MPRPGADPSLTVERLAGLVLVTDLGRVGHAHLGVPRSGALDLPAHRLANRLVGNDEAAATLECLGGGLRVRVGAATTVAVTGAQVPLVVDGRPRDWGDAVAVPRGAVVELGRVVVGLRAYLAVAGGVAVEPVLGSRSSDLLSGLGPPRVEEGDELPVGERPGAPRPVGVAVPPRVGDPLELAVGPREDWLDAAALETLGRAAYVVSSASNRVGLRLEGPALTWARRQELPSEGMVLGAVQVPPGGQPVVFLADHPTTGGYPVVGVLDAASVARCAQLAPGDEVRFRLTRP